MSGRFIIVDNKLIQFLGGTKEVVIPEGVLYIGDGAFRSYDIESVYIPEGTLEIGNNCFKSCRCLKKVTIPASVEKISDTAFADTSGVKVVTPKGSYAWERYQKKQDNPIKDNNVQKRTVSSGSGAATKTSTITSEAGSITKSSAQGKTSGTKVQSDENRKTIVNNSNSSSNQGTDSKYFVKKSATVSGTSQRKTIDVAGADSPENKNFDAKSASYQSKVYSTRNKEAEFARLLGCKVGECPWTMRNNAFGRVNRFVQRVKTISNQELLLIIAKEAQRSEIRCAAIENITSQDVLIKYAGDNHAGVRLAAIKNLEDQETLVKLAKDEHSYVREAAVKKVKDRSTVMQYLKKSDKSVSKELFKMITDVKGLQELASFARHSSVRKHAAGLLPSGSDVAEFLRAAADLSVEIEPYAIECLEVAIEKLYTTNPNFLAEMAGRYPFAGVRYLASQRADIKSSAAWSMEQCLSAKTPSQYELNLQKKIINYKNLLGSARCEVSNFEARCHILSKEGKTFCEYKVFKDYRDINENAYLFCSLLRTELKRKKFANAKVEMEETYTNNYYNKQMHTHYTFIISTRW